MRTCSLQTTMKARRSTSPPSSEEISDVDQRDEGDVGPVERVRETALVALRRQRHVTDDHVPIGFEQDPFDPPVFLTDFRTIHIATIGTFLLSPER